MAFSPGQCTSPQLHPCHRLFEQDGHQDSSSSAYSLDVAPCDFWLFPKLRGCRYETMEEMKEAVTKVIDTLTQGFSVRHYFGICVFFISQITYLQSPAKKRQLTSLCSLENHHVLAFFGCFFLSTNHGRGFASPLTHTWLIESEVLPYSYHLVMIERGEERDCLSFHYSAYYYSQLGQRVVSSSPITQRMY